MKKEDRVYKISVKKREGDIGQSLRITIPAAVVKELDINDKDELILGLENKKIVIQKS